MILRKFHNAHKKLKEQNAKLQAKKIKISANPRGPHAENRSQNKRAARRYADYILMQSFSTACVVFYSTPLITETSKADYVLFEASGLIKEGLIREWSRLSPDDIKALRAYLLAYVTGLAANSTFYFQLLPLTILFWQRRGTDTFEEKSP